MKLLGYFVQLLPPDGQLTLHTPELCISSIAVRRIFEGMGTFSLKFPVR
jgi:hypothetical protein